MNKSIQSQTYILSSDNPVIEIPINKNKDTYCINDAIFEIQGKEVGITSGPYLKYELVGKNETYGNSFKYKAHMFKANIKYELLLSHTVFRNISKYDTLVIKAEFFHPFTFELKVSNVNTEVPIVHLFEDFRTHISLDNNTRILFSSSFGQGKTTFINEFFEKHKSEYEVFKIYPVNYSVASNEDIFKYIKCEILYQLLGKNISFDKEEWNISTTLPEFILKQPEKLFAGFLKLLDATGHSWFSIYEPLRELINGVFAHKNEQQIDDRKSVEELIIDIYDKEGGIFEGNIYTQIIRQILIKIKNKNSLKKNILVIDDLDRMDPEHIFRILNVFSAHFDNHIYNEELSNKFGFDKIILVCDLDNIRNIYHHKFGEYCDFSGYINKYYSISPYYFNNVDHFIEFINKLSFTRLDDSPFDILQLVILDLINCGEFSLRNMNNFRSFDFSLILEGNKSLHFQRIRKYGNNNLDNAYFMVIYYLLKLFDIATLKNKLRKCINFVSYKRNPSYNYYTTSFALNVLIEPAVKEVKQVSIVHTIEIEDKEYKVFYRSQDQSNFGSFNLVRALEISHQNRKVEYQSADFYKYFLLNIDKYEKIGGLNGKDYE